MRKPSQEQLPNLPPVGLRDATGSYASERFGLLQAIESTLELAGFNPIFLPPFERFENLAPALAHHEEAELVRFVDPEDNRIAVLPPDATPQVARLWSRQATSKRSKPWHAFYRQTVVRRGAQRGRPLRQRQQAGFECIGTTSPAGELKVARTIITVCEALGMRDLTFEIGHVGAATTLLAALSREGVPLAQRDELRASFRAKDRARTQACLDAIAALTPASATVIRDARLDRLMVLHGGPEVLGEVAEAFPKIETDAATQALNLVNASPAISNIHLDFGDLSTIPYYTGLRFTILKPGLGEPLGSGGRYDDLLSHFGTPENAIGFAFDTDSMAHALQLQNNRGERLHE